MAPWELCTANGAIPDLDNLDVVGFPVKLAGQDDKQVGKPAAAPAATGGLPQVQIFWDIDFGGASAITSLNWYYVGDYWNDQISSIVVVQGKWRFYEHWHYEGRYWDSGVGYYRWVMDVGIPNDIHPLSFRVIG